MYKIEIVELLENDTKYATEFKIYEQKFTNLDIQKIALFLNTKNNFQALPKNETFIGQKECVFKNDDCDICPQGTHKDTHPTKP